MPVPWLRILDAAVGVTALARRVASRQSPATTRVDDPAATGLGGPIEARLAGVVVAALKEAFDRDHRRLELEKEQIEAEQRRAERALALELARQSGDREVGRLRLLAGVALASFLGTLFLSPRLIGGAPAARIALGVGWLLLLSALTATFVAQTRVGRSLDQLARSEMRPGVLDRGRSFELTEGSGDISQGSSGPAGAAALWLIVAALAAIALSVLLV